MKSALKELYTESRRDFDVWSYLWLFSDENNSIEFSHTELCGRFSLPLTTLYRTLKIYPEIWKETGIIVTQERLMKKNFKITFEFVKVKKRIAPPKEVTLYDDLFDWLKKHYAKINFDYADISYHKNKIKTICDKLTKAMKDRKTEVTDDSVKETFHVFFENIDSWWVNNGNITLPIINKNFTKILNQIKSNHGKNGEKRDSYSKAAEQVDGIDYDKLTKQQ